MHRHLFSLLGLLALAACGRGDDSGAGGPGGAMPAPEVGVIVAKAGNVPLRQDTVGRLAAFRSADVRARVPGVLQKRVYEEGSDVREGQVLFVIDPAPLRAALGQSRAALAQAQAGYANAKAAADRARQLLPQKFISGSDYDNALAAERSAAAAVEAGKAAVDSAEINLGYATVRAPISGRAGKQQVTEGALVGEGTATLLTTVDQIDPLYVNFTMSAAELDQIRRMQLDRSQAVSVQVLLPDGSVYGERGTVDFSGDIVDPQTGAVSLRATLPNPDRRLLPGTYVTLQATLGRQRGVFVVPQAAVQRDVSGAYVLVVGSDDKVVRKDVVTDRADDGNWVLGDGLAAGDRVIVSGLQKAKPGEPAKAVPWQRPDAQQAAGAAPAPGKGAAPGRAPGAAAKGDTSADAPASGD